MTKLSAIVSFLDQHLEISQFADPGINGLQVEGRADVDRVALGVSASLQMFEEARRWGAQAIIVHHGLIWKGMTRLVGPTARRFRSLLEGNVSLLAYHLPLDAHPVDGNNSLLARRLGLDEVIPWGGSGRTKIGAIGSLSDEPDIDELVLRVTSVCGAAPLVLGRGPQRLRTVAICSGGAGSMLGEAIDDGADVFITGEAGEPAQQLALEAGVFVLGAGHYNTERLGVQALCVRLEEELGIETRYFEIPNPV